jgi:BirA family biotin operon repressor/biotin-[acetyl-CoA-carboxylase] ligase
MGRGWVSVKGKGIYASIVLRPSLSPVEVAKLTLLSGVAVCESIQRFGAAATIKWPNDIMIEGKKAAGILTEMSAEMERVRFVIAGIGINVNTSSRDLPPHATSLKIATEKNIPRVKLLQEILARFEYWYDRCQKSGFEEMIREWKKLSSTLGRRVKLNDLAGSVEGEALDLDEHGGLVIRNDQGIKIKKMSGDVVVV